MTVTIMMTAGKRYPLAGMPSWQDVWQRYRQSALWPFCLTISMGVVIGTIGIVFVQTFHSRMEESLPFLLIGIICWNSVLLSLRKNIQDLLLLKGLSGSSPYLQSLDLVRSRKIRMDTRRTIFVTPISDGHTCVVIRNDGARHGLRLVHRFESCSFHYSKIGT